MPRRILLILLALAITGTAAAARLPDPEPAPPAEAAVSDLAVLHAYKLRRGKLLRLTGKREQYREMQPERLDYDPDETPPEALAKLAEKARQENAVMDDLMAGGDGSGGSTPWEKHTPEELAILYEKILALCEERACKRKDRQFSKELYALDEEVTAGRLSIGGLIDRAWPIFQDGLEMAKKEPPLGKKEK